MGISYGKSEVLPPDWVLQRSGLVTSFLGNVAQVCQHPQKMTEVPGWKGAVLRNKMEKLELKCS